MVKVSLALSAAAQARPATRENSISHKFASIRRKKMKKIIANILMVIISVQGLSVFGLAIPTGTVVVIKSAINTFGTGKCLDVAGGQTGTGTPIVQFDCHSGTNQRFVIERVGFGS